MKKLTTFLLLVLFLTATAGCGLFSKTVDPVTGENAYNNLREIFEEVILDAPGDPFDPKEEFETTEEYEDRLFERRMSYFGDSERYYGQIEQKIFILIHKIEELNDFNSDELNFEIPYQMSSYRLNSRVERKGPDFRLFIPSGAVEELHLFNEDYYEGGENFLAENGGFSKLTFFANVDREKAPEIREAAESRDVFVRLGIQFEFPEAFQGYRFLATRYEEYEEEERLLPSAYVKDLIEQDLSYGADEGVIGVKIVSIDFIDEDGVIYHSWPEDLAPAQTPTIAPTLSPTPFPTVVLPLEPTEEIKPTATDVPEPQEDFCEGAPEPRMEVGRKGRVTYGDPRRLRLRVEPTTSAAILRFLQLGQEFIAIGGPVCADNFVWWQIEFGNFSGYWVAEGEVGNYYIEPLD